MTPAGDVLLRFTQEWGRESALEDLTKRLMAPSDVEVRFWGGYVTDGHTYVVEVRRGGDYRASVIEQTKPESRADTLVQRLAALVQRVQQRVP